MEMVITFGLTVFMAAMSVPYYQRYVLNTNLKAAARDIASDFANLKQRAMTESTNFSILFNVGDNSYTLQQGGAALQVKAPSSFAKDIAIVSAPYGSGTTITFLTRGIVQQAGSVTLSNRLGSMATISTNISGKTDVQFTFR